VSRLIIKSLACYRPHLLTAVHRRNFTLKSGGDQWRRQDLVSGGTTTEAPKVPSGVGYGEGCPLPSRLGDPGERRELPQRSPGRSSGRYGILCMFQATERFW